MGAAQSLDPYDALESDFSVPACQIKTCRGKRHSYPVFATGTAQLRMVRLDDREQVGPRHHLLHLGQKDLARRRLALAQVPGITESQLHLSSPESRCAIVAVKRKFVHRSLSGN